MARCKHKNVVLTFNAPVYVSVRQEDNGSGLVYRVRVNDEIAPEYEQSATCLDCGKEVIGPARWQAIKIAEDATDWPGWEFGA